MNYDTASVDFKWFKDYAELKLHNCRNRKATRNFNSTSKDNYSDKNVSLIDSEDD